MIDKKLKSMLCMLLAVILLISPSLVYAADAGTVNTSPGTKAQETMTETETEEPPSGETEETESETKAPEGTLRGYIQTLPGVKAEQMLIRIYEAETYTKDDPNTDEAEDQDNQILEEVQADADGMYELTGMEPGSYCLEFVTKQENLDLTLFELVQSPEDVDYVFERVEGKDFFGLTEIKVEANQISSFHIQMLEKEAEEPTTEKTTEQQDPEPETKPAEATKSTEEETQKTAVETEPAAETETEEAEQTETEQAETAKNTKEETNSLPSLEDLANLPDDQVGATVTDTRESIWRRLARMVSGNEWTFEAYYVGQDDKYHVEKTSDFSLKYQMDFHTSRALKAGDVEIRIPARLLDDRNGTGIYPTDYAIPNGTMNDYVESRYSPFNYYIDEATDEVVFFNYRDIPAGNNVAFQVLYKNVKVMDIVDQTEWEMPVKIEVTYTDDGGQTVTEAREPESLTGVVNTEVNLNTVTKKAHNAIGKSYTPGLYTEKQVLSYINDSTLPQMYRGSNFDNYVYVVWEVNVNGNATQPWNLIFKDETNHSGTIVGYRDINGSEVADEDYAGYVNAVSFSKGKEIKKKFYVVTAYPKDEVPQGTVLQNDIDVVLQPFDQVDDDQNKSVSALWSYKDYVWIYPLVNTVNAEKRAWPLVYSGWLDIYDLAVRNGRDEGDFSYTARTSTTGYHLTHYTTGEDIGKRIEGAEYKMTTVDDVLYAFSSNDASDIKMLSDEDYYFSRVKVTQRDTGYDIWEDMEDVPEVSGNLVVSAMFAGESDWEEVAVVPWSSNGVLSYSFDTDDLARQPWRVKAEHRTVNYTSDCEIEVSVRIRHNSQIFADLLEVDPRPESITVHNLCGIIGEAYQDDEMVGYYHNSGDFNYKKYPDDLTEVTEELYDTLAMRSSAQVNTSWLVPKAESFKTSKATNDPQNGRVKVNYVLTAYDGYQIYSNQAISALRTAGIESPGRNEVVFYDLLPYGVQFDPAVPVTVGRTDASNDYKRSQPSYWDQSQVEVTVDSDHDIIPNYRNTGRTRVAFHIRYTGADSAFYSDVQQMWLEGWGVSFGAYYEWKDVDVVSKVPNISAFMPEKDDNEPLLGAAGEVFQDNGDVPAGQESIYGDFGEDIDADGNMDERNVLFANNTVYEDIAMASESNITKLVKADANRFGVFDTSAVVEEGKGYTYEIAVGSAQGELKNIFIFDRLENAYHDRKDIELNYGFRDEFWHGTFDGLQLRGLTEAGIAPQVYYHGNRETAPLPAESGEADVKGNILTEANGWYTKERWEEEHQNGTPGFTLEDVQAFAIDIGMTAGGEEFALQSLESVSFQVHMTAPVGVTEIYAYNNPSFHSYETNSKKHAWVAGETVKAELARAKDLEVEKRFKGDIPKVVEGTKFEFTAYQEIDGSKGRLGNREYFLLELDGEGVWQQAGGLYATDARGRFYLKAGQKAVFKKMASVETISVVETESPFWKQEDEDKTTDDKREIVFINEYQPVLYAQKKVANVPEKTDVSEEIFTFQLLVDGQPLAFAEYWYVDSARTDGGIPRKVTSKGTNGVGTTDDQGRFPVKIGDIIALFPGETGVTYTLKEVGGAGEGTNWFCKTDEVSGTVLAQGSSASITNYYRWKDLYLTKKITNQDAADCEEEFTFRITDENDQPVVGNSWIIGAGEAPGTSGVLDDDGKFTAACAGQTIRIIGLEAGKTYLIQETVSGELYQAVNDGLVEVTMPQYGMREDAEITNDYLKRPLSVTKILLYDENDAQQVEDSKIKPFYMKAWVDEELLVNTPYTIYQNGEATGTGETGDDGEFPLLHGQTAVFDEIGMKGDSFVVWEKEDDAYGRIFPLEAEFTGNLNEEQNLATFINGTSNGNMLLRKEYVGSDEAGTDAVAEIKRNTQLRKEAAVKLTMEIISETGVRTVWPETDQEVTVIDALDGSLDTVTWRAKSPIELEPWKTISLIGMDSSLDYRVYESKGDQQRMLEWQDDRWIEITQKTPASNKAVTGNIGENPLAVIVNNAASVNPVGSRIHKTMRIGADPVATGAKLVWRLEEFDGDVWNPKSGITYVIYDETGDIISDQTLTTGDDGLITLVKPEQWYPAVHFIEAKVKINYYSGMGKGDLRLVEVIEASDPEWGYLSGYVNENGAYGTDIPADEAVAFMNSNTTAVVEIGKKMEDPTDDTFTMILSQVVKASTYPVTDKDQIDISEVRGGIRYTIHDSETNALLGEGMTTARGEIFIKAGQYVKLSLPDETLWTVSEQVVQPYVLKEMKGNPETEFTKLDDNLMLIQPRVEREVLPIALTKDMVRYGVIDARTGRHVVLKTGDVVIPSTINYYGQERVITSIADAGVYTSGAFYGAPITSVVFPDTITHIGSYAFFLGTDIEGELKLPPNLVSIGNDAFYTVSKITGDLVIPETVTYIGDRAFESCRQLSGLKLPTEMSYLGERAFLQCSNLTGDLQLPVGLTRIEEKTFSSCSKLTGNVIIPDGVISIGKNAFAWCTGFTGSLEIPESVSVIDDGAFTGCSGLTGELVLPSEMSKIGIEAFANCKNLTGELVLPGNLSKIENYVFYRCTGFTGDLIIPSNVTSIGNNAFTQCRGFNGVLELPQECTSIGDSAFEDCDNLTGELVIPENVTQIGNRAFDDCVEFRGELIFPIGLTQIGNEAFSNCWKLTGDLVIPSTVTTLGEGAFQNCSSFNGDLVIQADIEEIKYRTFYQCIGFEGELELPQNLTKIGNYAFYNCNRLSGNLVIPSSVSQIGKYAFHSCRGFTGELVLPSSLTKIDDAAFTGCNGLTGSLVIPPTVTSLGADAFGACYRITGELVIPSTVTELKSGIFYNTGITSIVIEPGVVELLRNVFGACQNLKEVSIPNTVTSIHSQALNYSPSLESVIIDNTPNSIPGYENVWGAEKDPSIITWLRP